jgi:diguanylate cyclase (GGDEF)-like protein/PAS domain S-box-containing protein
MSEGRYRSLFVNSIDGIYRSTKNGKYIDVNPSLVKMLGYGSKEELLSINIATELYKDPSERPPTEKRNRIFETRFKKKNGDTLWVQISTRVLYDENKLPYYEGIVRDITEQKISQRKIEYLSFHDKLTGLYNRAFFEEELKRLDTVRKYPLSIVYGDINGLKSVNDRYGHQEGDRLLCEVARIIKICFRKEDLVARWGGDEFIIILPHTDIDIANEIIDRISSKCLMTKFKRKPISISLGAATKFDEKMSIDSVVREAERKMYVEKGKVREYQY